MNQSRRNFLSAACTLCAAAVLAPAALAAVNEEDDDKKPKLKVEDGKVLVPAALLTEKLNSFKVKGLPRPLLVIKNPDAYDAYLLKCTHMGVAVKIDGDELACPAHGSRFNQQGGVIKGPAKEPLTRYKVNAVADGVEVIVA